MRRSGSRLLLSVLALAGLFATYAAQAPASTAAPIRSITFKGFTWSQDLHTRVGSRSQAWNRPQNVTRADGSLFVKTARYCTAGGAEPTSGAAPHPAKCPRIADTTYATGRLQVGGLRFGTDFSVSFTANMPGTSGPGSRMALWMVHGPYCDSDPATSAPTANADFGELDLLEWYSRTPSTSHSTTHVACDVARHRPFLSDANAAAIPTPPGTHTWKVVRHGNRVRYLRDGHQLGNTHVCGSGDLTANRTPPRCGSILRGPWTLVIQGEVFANECGASCGILTGPNDFDRFPTQVMRVRGVNVTGRA